MTIPLKNPITKRIEESERNINILVSENKLQEYFSASFIEDHAFDIALPFYIEAHSRNKHTQLEVNIIKKTFIQTISPIKRTFYGTISEIPWYT